MVLSRLHGPSSRNDTRYRSTYEVWNDDYLRGIGLWDDVPYPRYQRIGSRAATQRRNTTHHEPRVPAPRRESRFEALAAPKRYGQCGPRCMKHRCAAIEHEHKPSCAAGKRKQRKGEHRPMTSAFPGIVQNIHTTMTSMQAQDRIPNHDLTMGTLKDMKKGELPSDSQTCERNCGECSNAPREESMAMTNPESSTHDTGLKSMTRTKTEPDYAIPRRVLKEQNSNIMQELPAKAATSPVRRVKIPTPLPRVALLKPPKQKYYQHANELTEKMIKSAVERDQLHPKAWVLSPKLLTPRRATTVRKACNLQTQKPMAPGKLAPRLFTPPTSIPSTRTNSNTPRSQEQDSQQAQLEPTEVLQTIQAPNSEEILNLEEALNPSEDESPRGHESLVTSTAEFESSSEGSSNRDSIEEESLATPMCCLCSLCGKSESVAHTDGGAVYRSNPLYSPPQSVSSGRDVSPGVAVIWRLLCTLMEVLVFVGFGGALTLWLVPYVESVFRAYVADFCRCSGKGVGAGPALTADGMQSGVVKWVSCMMDDGRATLTSLR
jgi:hypothetical protein